METRLTERNASLTRDLAAAKEALEKVCCQRLYAGDTPCEQNWMIGRPVDDRCARCDVLARLEGNQP